MGELSDRTSGDRRAAAAARGAGRRGPAALAVALARCRSPARAAGGLRGLAAARPPRSSSRASSTRRATRARRLPAAAQRAARREDPGATRSSPAIHLALDDLPARRGRHRQAPRHRPRVPARALRPAALRPPGGGGEARSGRRRSSARSRSRWRACARRRPPSSSITGEEIARRGYTDVEAVLRDLPGFDFSSRAGAVLLEHLPARLPLDRDEPHAAPRRRRRGQRPRLEHGLDLPPVRAQQHRPDRGRLRPGLDDVRRQRLRGRRQHHHQGPRRPLVGEGRPLGRRRARWAVELDARDRSTRPSPGRARSGALALVADRAPLEGRRLRAPRGLPRAGTTTRPSTTPSTTRGSSSLNVDRRRGRAGARARSTRPSGSSPLLRRRARRAGPGRRPQAERRRAPRAARGFDKSAFAQTVVGRAWASAAGRRLAGLRQAADLELRLRLPALAHRGAGRRAPRRHLRRRAGSNGFLWTPRAHVVFAKYSQRFLGGQALVDEPHVQYKQHDLDGTDSADVFLSELPAREPAAPRTSSRDKAPAWTATYNYRSNDQLRTELNLYYEHVGEAERGGRRRAALQLDRRQERHLRRRSRPARRARSPTPIAGGNQIASRDLGAYLQASYRPGSRSSSCSASASTTTRSATAAATARSPTRAWRPSTRWRDFVFKGIYAEAFQDAPNFQKFETVTGVARARQPDARPRAGEELRAVGGLEAAHDLTCSSSATGRPTRGSWRRCRASPARRRSAARRRTSSRTSGAWRSGACRARRTGRPAPSGSPANYTYAHPARPRPRPARRRHRRATA